MPVWSSCFDGADEGGSDDRRSNWPGGVSLQLVFARLGAECAELGGLAEQLQSVLAPALLRLADNGECHRNVQSLDLFAQRLAGMATILECAEGAGASHLAGRMSKRHCAMSRCPNW